MFLCGVRRFLIIFLALSIGVNASAEKAGRQQPLTLAYGLENYDLSLLFDRFEKKTGIKVNVVAFKNNELKSELIQRANIQQLPDAVIVPSDFAGLRIINVSSIPESLLSKDLDPMAKRSSEVRGISRGIPIIFGNHLVLYYNKALIDSVAHDWKTLLNQKDSLSDNTEIIGWNYMEMYWLIPFLGAYNSFPYLDGEVALQAKGMEQALVWYKSFVDKNLVDQECDHDCVMDKFVDGKLAYIINGSWAYRRLSDELGDNLGVELLPDYQGKKMKTYFSSHLLAFPDNGLQGFKQTELTQLASYFQSEEAQKLIWTELRSIPTKKSVLAELKKSQNANVAKLLLQLDFAEPMPNEHNMAIIWEAMLKGFNRYLAGVLDAQSAAEYMQYVAKKSIEHADEKK